MPKSRCVRTVATLALLAALVGCGSRQLRLASAGKGTPHYTVATALMEVWEQELSYQWALDTLGEGSVDNLEQLIREEVEFALVQNDATVRAGHQTIAAKLRTVLPLYEQVFFLIYKGSHTPASLQELVYGHKVCVGPKGGGTAFLTQALFRSLGLDSSRYSFQYSTYTANRIGDTVSISVSVTSPHNPLIREMLAAGGRIWSLDAPERFGKGCTAEAFCQVYPMARAILLPRHRYPKQENPIVSLAVDNVLITRADTDPTLVYDLVQTAFAHRRELGERSPLFLGLSENLSEDQLHYPLHEGTENYLRRNEPHPLVRYAELISLLITVGSLVYGGVVLVARRRRAQIRANIGGFYEEVLSIEEDIPQLRTPEACDKALHRLHSVRLSATRQLALKKLEADTAFRILLDLIDQAQEAIFEHRTVLHRHSVLSYEEGHGH